MKWIRGEAFRITGLYLLIIPFLNALNATGFVNPQIQGYFGASSTEFMYINMIPVFILIAGVPLALELSKQFQLRPLLLFIIVVSIIFNTCSAYSTDIRWYTFFRSLVAFFSIFGIVASLIPLALRYNPTFNMAIMYGIVQFIIQGSSHLYKYLGAHFAQIYDWRTSLLLLNINFFLCIILTWVFLKHGAKKQMPVFKFDFTGWLILVLFLSVLLFLACEGQTREWFSDPEVSLAFSALLILIGIYIFYSRFATNPLIDLKVFRYKNVVWGTLFFFLIGLLNNTGSVIMGFMSGLLGFNDIIMAETHLYTCIGLLISIPVCTYMLFHRIHLRITAIAGFLSFTLYHLLMYFGFYPGIAEVDFVLPLIFKGMGIGFLYVLSSLYISENIPKPLSTSRMMSGLISRNVIAMLFGAAILSTTLSQLTLQHKTGISQQFSKLNKDAAQKFAQTEKYYMSQGFTLREAEQMATKSLQKEYAQSATLLAYKDVYLIMVFISFFPVLIILVMGIGRRPVSNVNVEPIPF